MPKAPKVLASNPENMEYITIQSKGTQNHKCKEYSRNKTQENTQEFNTYNISTDEIQRTMDELVSNYNLEDYIQNIGNKASISNLEEVRSSTSNEEN